MSFRARLEEVDETVHELEFASEARYAEGVLLLTDEATRTASVYLLGYAAEMLLKTAYFRFEGASSSDRVGPLLETAKIKARNLNVIAERENYHSLRFWSQLLLATRNYEARDLPKRIADNLTLHTTTLYENWWVEMRYRRLAANDTEILAVKKSVEWLRNRYDGLWR